VGVNKWAYSGDTALMLASEMGHLEVVKLLLDKGAKVDAKTKSGKTALDIAIQNGHSRIAELLGSKK